MEQLLKGSKMDLIYIAIPLLLMFLSQSYIKRTYSKYRTVKSRRKMNGYNTARKMIEKYDLNVNIEKAQGLLSDHYDPREKVVRLSEDVYENDSIASIAIAAHECAHVIQHKEGYFLIKLRSILVPVISLTSKI
jgi:Zn-dependent membrane protease YugP